MTNSALNDTWFEWSPDSQQIVYVSQYTDRNLEIHLVNADGSNVRRLTYSAQAESFPMWSSDGGQVAFEGVRDRRSEIFIISADGSGERRLTENQFTDRRPVWLPLVNPFG